MSHSSVGLGLSSLFSRGTHFLRGFRSFFFFKSFPCFSCGFFSLSSSLPGFQTYITPLVVQDYLSPFFFFCVENSFDGVIRLLLFEMFLFFSKIYLCNSDGRVRWSIDPPPPLQKGGPSPLSVFDLLPGEFFPFYNPPQTLRHFSLMRLPAS